MTRPQSAGIVCDSAYLLDNESPQRIAAVLVEKQVHQATQARSHPSMTRMRYVFMLCLRSCVVDMGGLIERIEGMYDLASFRADGPTKTSFAE